MREDDLIGALDSLLVGAASRGSGCPSDAELAAFAGGGAGERERQRLEAHLGRCDRCLGVVGFHVRLASRAPGAVPETLLERVRPLAFERRPDTSRWRWAAAAALAAVIGAGLWATFSNPDARGAGRGAVTRDALRGPATASQAPAVLRPEPGARVDRGQLEVAWREVPHSLYYEVSVVTRDGELVWRGRSREPRVRPPADTLLVPGARYFVWVSAYLPEGKSLRSRATPFEIAWP